MIMMRIAHFEKLLEEAISNLQLNSTRHGNNITVISNWPMVCNTMQRLEEYKFIEPLIVEIFALGAHFEAPTKTLSLDDSMYSNFYKLHGHLITVLNTMLTMIHEFFPKEKEYQINIKLPDTMSLAEMSHYISEIDFIFNKMQALRKINENNDFVLSRVDAGSVWLILVVAVPAAITTVGMIVKLSLDVKRRLLEDDIVKQRLRVLKSGANVIEILEKELTDELKKDCEEKAKKLNDDTNLTLGHEEISTLSMGIERLGN